MERSGSNTKAPYDPVTGKQAKPDQPDTFMDCNSVSTAVNGYDGNELLAGSGCCIDLDDCFDSI